jgi:hypothetical protein
MPRFSAVSALAVSVVFVAGCGGGAASVEPDAGLVVTSDTLARYPTAATDPASGVTYVAWTRPDGLGGDVYLARVGAAVEGAPVRVNDRPGEAEGHAQAPAQVAVGADGAVYVVWVTTTDVPGRRFPASDLRLARSTDGGRTFAPAATVNDDAGFLTGHHFHDVLVGADGAVYVSWLDGREKDRARQAAGTGAEGDGGHGAHGGSHGGHSGPGTEVRVARSADGGRTFGPSVVVAEGTCECCRTRLALGPDGALYVAWRHQFERGGAGAPVRDVAVARSDDGGRTFGPATRVHADGWRLDGCPHAGPALAVDDAGRLHVAWYTGAPERAGLYHAVSADRGASFAAPQPIVRDVPVAPVALAPGAGCVWLAWEDGPADATHAACLTPGRPLPAAQATSPGAAPVVTAHGARGVVVRQDRGVRLLSVERG